MIEAKEALQKILAHAYELDSEMIPVNFCQGRFLAQEVVAPVASPLFDQSAMDGYAIHAPNPKPGNQFEVVGEIPAGFTGELKLSEGEAARIFTGAPVPPGATAVVMQEYVERAENQVTLTANVRPKDHIRFKGEQIEAGQIALAKGTLLDAAAIGFLGTMGIYDIACLQTPVVAILTTGDEFAASAEDLRGGKIFESNSYMLRGALLQMGIESFQATVPDDPQEIKNAIAEAANMANILLTTGGVSVGAYDHTRGALEAAGFEIEFHKVNQKPGKPLLFGSKHKRAAFGLPGNPRSALMGFYKYVYPYIRSLMGAQQLELPTLRLPLSAPYQKKDGKTHFLTGNFKDGTIDLSAGQNSHLLKSFAEADAIVEIPAEKKQMEAGDTVQTWVLPR